MIIKQLFCTITFYCVVVAAAGQNLSGIWRGSFYNVQDIMLGGSKYRYEVQLDDNSKPIGGMKGLGGVTYSYQTTRFYGKASLEGVWTPSSSNVVLRETKLQEVRIAEGGDGCLMTCYLDYRKDGTKEYMEGNYTSVSVKTGKACGGGKVILEKVLDTDFELEPFLKPDVSAKSGIKPGQEGFLVKKDTDVGKSAPPNATSKPKVVPPKPPVLGTAKNPPPSTKATTKATTPNRKLEAARPSTDSTKLASQPKGVIKPPSLPAVKPKIPVPPVLQQRSNELFETIETASKTLIISFYDNGEVDGDVISVYDNNRLIAQNKALTTKPIEVIVNLSDEEPTHEIVMVAENLGSIPPNTALMIVQAGEQRYNVRLSSTEQKNAMVRFRYKP